MLQTNIIASSITNLTDARYFAAWGAYAMGFDLNVGSANLVSPAQVHAFKDWISGPIIIGEFSGLQSRDEIDELIKTLSLDAIQLGPFAPQEWRFEIPVYREVFVNKTEGLPEADFYIIKSEATFEDKDRHQITAITEASPSFIDLSLPADQYLGLIKKANLNGLVLRGGAEEKVGYKSYDEIDEILEALENTD